MTVTLTSTRAQPSRALVTGGTGFIGSHLTEVLLDDGVEVIGDVVFHLAAEPGVRASWGPHFQRYVTNNILATQQLLRSLQAVPGRRLVYASSSAIYGQAELLPTPEATPPAPRPPYGLT